MGILNDRIKERRLALNLTLLDVAEKIGVKEATIQRYESGQIKNIKHSTIVALAEVLQCSPAYLMGWEKNPDASAERETAENVIIYNRSGRKVVKQLTPEQMKIMIAMLDATDPDTDDRL